MTSRSASNDGLHVDYVNSPYISGTPLQNFPPERYSDLVRRRGGLISIPRKLSPSRRSSCQISSKLLLKVTIEKSMEPVKVVMLSENTVGDLVKAAVEIYQSEKRRPLLPETNHHRFELHYSQFSLESLKVDQKLMSLGSRNFYLCLIKLSNSYEKAKKATEFDSFLVTKLMDIML